MEVIQTPNGDGSTTSTYGAGYGFHTEAGTCPLVDSATGIYTSVDDVALNETQFGYLRSRTGGTEANPGRLEFVIPEPPAGIVVSGAGVVLTGWLRLANAGGSFWSGDVSVYGFVNIGGTRYAGSTVVLSAAASVNTNTSGPTGTFARYTLGAWAVSPASGITWTLSELATATCRVGIAADSPNVPNSAGGADHHVDLAHLERTITYSLSSTMSEPLRATLSHGLLLRERPVRRARIVVPHQFATVEPGDVIYSATGSIPTPGDAVGTLAAVDAPASYREHPLTVCRVEHDVVATEHRIDAVDVRPIEASLWWPMISDQGVDVNDAGIAYYDQGGGFVSARAQVGYARRPDGLYVARASSAAAAGLRYHSVVSTVYPGGPGLHLEGGATEHGLLNNTFSQWGGGAPTSWTVYTAGSSTVTQDTADYLIAEPGLTSCAKFTLDAGANAAYVYQSFAGWTAGTYGRVRITYKADDIAAPPRWLLRRSDGADWNWATQAWVGGSPGLWTSCNPGTGDIRDSDYAAGKILEYRSKVFTPGGSYDMTLLVGYPPAASKTVRVYYASLARSTSASCPAWRLVPTVGAAVTTVGDSVTINNADTYRVLRPDRGTVSLRFTPDTPHSQLPDAGLVRVFASYWQGSAVGTEYDRLWYRRVDATNGEWRYQRYSGAGSIGDAVWAATGSDLLAAGHEYKLAIRWTGTDGELGLAARTLSLFVDGALRASGPASADVTKTTAAVVQLGPVLNGSPLGWFSRLRLHEWCLTDAEILRRMS